MDIREEEGSPSCPPTTERSHDTVALALWEVHIPKGQGMLETLLGSASSRLEGQSVEGLWAVTPRDLSPDRTTGFAHQVAFWFSCIASIL